MARGSPEIENPAVIHQPDTTGDEWLSATFARCRHKLVRAATRMLRRLAIHEADLDGDGAVNLAFAELRKTFGCAGPRVTGENDEFLRLAHGAVRRVVLQQRRRSRSLKRGGRGRNGEIRGQLRGTGADDSEGSHRGFRRIEAELDLFASGEATVEEVVGVKLEFEALIERLPDHLHRTILIMHHQGFSIAEIARDLDLHPKTVSRKLNDIERIYRHWAHRSR